MIDGLKTQLPQQFATTGKGDREVDPHPLPKGDDRKTEPQSLAEALEMQAAEGK